MNPEIRGPQATLPYERLLTARAGPVLLCSCSVTFATGNRIFVRSDIPQTTTPADPESQ
jgi:hypothetical protein